ncbi:MAG: serine/threonine protein kinase [Planctomycetes bacterium]|nr:serine/threonine protein kinase [Planctomycetota bacterium]
MSDKSQANDPFGFGTPVPKKPAAPPNKPSPSPQEPGPTIRKPTAGGPFKPPSPPLPPKPIPPPRSTTAPALAPTMAQPHRNLASMLSITSSTMSSVAQQDLSSEKLLMPAGRSTFEGRPVPALGGIPLLAKLGQGGMGAVYFGIEPQTNREVAVKILPFHQAEQDPEMIQRFIREAKIASQVKGAHLVETGEAREEQGLYYLVMEFVAGPSAGKHMKLSHKSGLPEADALDLCIAATEGLITAHAAGVIHRDIKPDNILIPQDAQSGALKFDQAKLADLGLARLEEHGQSLTASQMSMGTPGYMAPEQAMDARKAGKSADLFSMGATLYALLSGRAPFHGKAQMEILMDTLNKPHEALSNLRPDASPASCALIDRCLAKEPQRRFADVKELLKALKWCRKILGRTGDLQSEAVAQFRAGLTAPLKDDKTPAPDPAQFDPTMQAQSAFRQRAAGMPQLRDEAPRNSQRTTVAAVLLALFMGAGIAVLFMGGGEPNPEPDNAVSKFARDTDQAAQMAKESVQEVQRTQAKAAFDPKKQELELNTKEGQFKKDYMEGVAGSLEKAMAMGEKQKIVAPMTPISSVSSEDGLFTSGGTSKMVFCFIMSIIGMAYLIYSRGKKDLTFGIAGALMIMYGWFIPWFAAVIVIGGLLVTVPLFLKTS